MLKRVIGWMLGLVWARASAEREPFWSVSKGVRNQFFLILSFFWVAGLALSVYLTLNCIEGAGQPCTPAQSVPSAIYGVLERFSKIALGATVAAAMVTPPLVFTGDVIMGVYEAISERWGKIATERRVAEAIAQAVSEAVAEAREEAAAEARAEMAADTEQRIAEARAEAAEAYAQGVAAEQARQEALRRQQDPENKAGQ